MFYLSGQLYLWPDWRRLDHRDDLGTVGQHLEEPSMSKHEGLNLPPPEPLYEPTAKQIRLVAIILCTKLERDIDLFELAREVLIVAHKAGELPVYQTERG